MKALIYHNPACGTSRNTLALLRHAGLDVDIVDYVANPPTRMQLLELVSAAGLTVRESLREKGTPYADLGLDDASLSDDQLLDAMLAHPILIQRPFVVTGLGVRLCRPSEKVLEILPAVERPFTKEDGEVVIGADGRRVK